MQKLLPNEVAHWLQACACWAQVQSGLWARTRGPHLDNKRNVGSDHGSQGSTAKEQHPGLRRKLSDHSGQGEGGLQQVQQEAASAQWVTQLSCTS